jgi:hypothetical protein
MKRILLATLLIAPAAFAADQTGRFEPGTKYEAPAAHAPANVSRMFAKTLPRDTASVDIPAAGNSGMIIWTIPIRSNTNGPAVRTRLTSPTGARLQANERGSVERGLRRFAIDAAESAELDMPRGAQDVLHVMRTEAANYRLDLDLPADVAGVTVVAAEPESAITLSTWAAPLSRQPGQPVTLHAELRDGDAPIRGAYVTARLASPRGKAFDTIELTDAGNGIYTATVTDLPDRIAGAWQVRFEAEGATANGVRFARTGSGELVSERGSARLGTIQAQIVGDNLRVTVPAEILNAGTYRLDVIAAADGQSLAWGQGMRTLSPGATTLTLDLPLSTTRGLHLDVRLLGMDEIGVAGTATADLP